MSEIRPHRAQAYHPLKPIISPLPFTTWVMDTLGPCPKATGQHKYLFVAVDYFTKWTEAEAVALIIATEARKFMWKNIINHYGVLWERIFDND